MKIICGGIAKWTKATVCKTVTLGSNPSAAFHFPATNVPESTRMEWGKVAFPEKCKNTISDVTANTTQQFSLPFTLS